VRISGVTSDVIDQSMISICDMKKMLVQHNNLGFYTDFNTN